MRVEQGRLNYFNEMSDEKLYDHLSAHKIMVVKLIRDLLADRNVLQLDLNCRKEYLVGIDELATSALEMFE